MNINRIEFIDVAKGIGILLVVWLHMPSIGLMPQFEYWGGYITTFYMPLFFLMSGMFFKPINIMKKVKRLLTSYICFYILAYAVYVVKSILKHDNVDWINFIAPFAGATYGYQNTPIWFLLSLMEIILMAFGLVKIKNQFVAIFFAFILAVLASFSHEILERVPYYIDVSMICLPFFLLGYYLKEKIFQLLKGKIVLVLGIVSITAYIMAPAFTNVSQNSLPQGFILFFVVAITASLSIIGICKYVHGTIANIFSFLGRNSLVIMCTHMMLMMIDTAFMGVLHNVIVANILSLLLIMVVEVGVCILITRYCSFMIGR